MMEAMKTSAEKAPEQSEFEYDYSQDARRRHTGERARDEEPRQHSRSRRQRSRSPDEDRYGGRSIHRTLPPEPIPMYAGPVRSEGQSASVQGFHEWMEELERYARTMHYTRQSQKKALLQSALTGQAKEWVLGFEGAVWEDMDFQEVLATMFTDVVGSDRDIGKAWQSMYDDQIMQRQDEPVIFFYDRLRRMSKRLNPIPTSEQYYNKFMARLLPEYRTKTVDFDEDLPVDRVVAKLVTWERNVLWAEEGSAK